MTNSPNLALAEKIEQQIFLRYGPWCDIGLERKEWDQVIAALRAQPSGDWVWVPREATAEMVQAMEDRQIEGASYIAENSIQFALWKEVWKAAITAALSAAKERE